MIQNNCRSPIPASFCASVGFLNKFLSFRKYSFNALHLRRLPCLSNTPKESGLSKVCLISLQRSSVKRKRGVSDLVIYSSNKIRTLGSNGPLSGGGDLYSCMKGLKKSSEVGAGERSRV